MGAEEWCLEKRGMTLAQWMSHVEVGWRAVRRAGNEKGQVFIGHDQRGLKVCRCTEEIRSMIQGQGGDGMASCGCPSITTTTEEGTLRCDHEPISPGPELIPGEKSQVELSHACALVPSRLHATLSVCSVAAAPTARHAAFAVPKRGRPIRGGGAKAEAGGQDTGTRRHSRAEVAPHASLRHDKTRGVTIQDRPGTAIPSNSVGRQPLHCNSRIHRQRSNGANGHRGKGAGSLHATKQRSNEATKQSGRTLRRRRERRRERERKAFTRPRRSSWPPYGFSVMAKVATIDVLDLVASPLHA